MEYNPQVRNRMKRIEGQVRGIVRMMEEGKDCKDVVTQMSAVRTAIDRTMGLVVSSNLVDCVLHAEERDGEDPKAYIEEAVNLLVKSR
ncbi:metal-sensitive transcriptional regulator [Amphibacillus jilinensis]|uniref:metal-sensitive transcriptional regulator n=1 Tax=Amphibacillus jilinensis TaxID=1216008 RepID=UPI000305464E|nr:metal-sensitive transcriptional regulator [Amphibacillus jilinensis]